MSQNTTTTTAPSSAARLDAYLHDPEERCRRNEAMIRLLDEWMADESGYDEETWPEIEAAPFQDRVAFRQPVDE